VKRLNKRLEGDKMKKDLLIIVFGSLIYWFFTILFHKIFENIGESFRFFQILFTASIAPFILGFIISMLLKTKKGWIYGGVSYLLYFIWVFVLGWVIEFHLKGFTEHLLAMSKAYFYLGSIATLFAAFGGFIGDYIRKIR
jgi:hypothetical protein